MSTGNQSISPSDLEEAWRIFDEDGVARSRVRFAYDDGTDQWCLRDSADDSCVAMRNPPPDAIEWVRT